MPSKTFKGVQQVCLIGGGDLMAATAKTLQKRGKKVSAILAPRHACESLVRIECTLEKRLSQLGVRYIVSENINALEWCNSSIADLHTLALCFGPSWIFSKDVIAQFGFGMINVNPIPAPKYLGGAHYTWQILNNDHEGGCCLQEITADIDRGPILMQRKFNVPESAIRPRDYFDVYFDKSFQCLEDFFDLIESGAMLERVAYESMESNRLYFPRLRTVDQAYVDWDWTSTEIKRFCDAFDDPYSGAMTFLNETRIHLKNVELVNLDTSFHPFTTGLVVRHWQSTVIVAARGGGLSLGAAHDDGGRNVKCSLREGQRLFTPRTYIELSRTYRPRLSPKGFE